MVQRCDIDIKMKFILSATLAASDALILAAPAPEEGLALRAINDACHHGDVNIPKA